MEKECVKKGAVKNCLSIAGVDPSGGAGVLADIKAMSACGVYAMGVVTALLCPTMLRLMNTDASIFDSAVSYIRLIFAAIPAFNMLRASMAKRLIRLVSILFLLNQVYIFLLTNIGCAEDGKTFPAGFDSQCYFSPDS